MKRVLIMGAGGRDFHNFNMVFRNDPRVEVVGFTAAQIPELEGRRYPPILAGERYKRGIPIYSEAELESLIRKLRVDEVVFAYSDVSHEYVMHRASMALARGASFRILGPRETQIQSVKPVIAITAVRTGAGKSQTTRRVASILRSEGLKPIIVRHPMAYGSLSDKVLQRFTDWSDLDAHPLTLEEREEFERHLELGFTVYCGVDYELITREAEKEADVLIWDGGNNDFPFIAPDLLIVVADPHRPGEELASHPGETNFRTADIIIINKVDTAPPEAVNTIHRNAEKVNPGAIILEAASPIFVDDPEAIRARKVLVIEDGPTLTHGGMAYGAGYIAAKKAHAKQIISPVNYARGNLKKVFEEFPQVREVLPAMGYSRNQIRELERLIDRCPAEVIVSGTPVNLRSLVKTKKPIVRVRYELQELGKPTLADLLRDELGELFPPRKRSSRETRT
ncbi:MAG: cyclic 2,3-diphosphoglycerate synthase [bacterium JZ-2024 1]